MKFNNLNDSYAHFHLNSCYYISIFYEKVFILRVIIYCLNI